MLHPPLPLWPAILLTSGKKQEPQGQFRYQNPNDGWSPPQNRWYIYEPLDAIVSPTRKLLKSGNPRHSSLSSLRSPPLLSTPSSQNPQPTFFLQCDRPRFTQSKNKQREKLYFRVFQSSHFDTADGKQRKAYKRINFTSMWPCIVTNFFIIKPTRCTNFTNLFWQETVHVSDSSSVHHQEFIHCTLSNGICHTGL